MSRAAMIRRPPAGDICRRPAGARSAEAGHRQTPLEEELAPAARPRPGSRREERPRPGAVRAPAGAGGGRLTLGDVVAGAWEDLLAAGSAPCPMCGGRMERERDVGRCGGCGSALS